MICGPSPMPPTGVDDAPTGASPGDEAEEEDVEGMLLSSVVVLVVGKI